MRKAFSLLQPWAQLSCLGLKRVETRSWNTQYRGRLYIHASASKNMGMLRQDHDRFLLSVYRKYAPQAPGFNSLPFGCIIGHVDVVDTFQFGSPKSVQYLQSINGRFDFDREISFGDWSEGRWGWKMENPVLFDTPVPCKGALSIWTIDESIVLP